MMAPADMLCLVVSESTRDFHRTGFGIMGLEADAGNRAPARHD